MIRFLFALTCSIALVVSAIFYDQYTRSHRSGQWAQIEIKNNLERELAALEGEANGMIQSGSSKWSDLGRVFFLIDSGRIKAWSRNDFPFHTNELFAAEDFSVARFSRFTGFVRKWNVGGSATLIGIIPLSAESKIVNEYVHPWINRAVFPEGTGYTMQPGGELLQVCIHGKCLFNTVVLPAAFSNQGSLVLLWIGIGSLCAAVYFLILFLHHGKRYFLSFVVLFVTLGMTRIAMVEFAVPSKWTKNSFFDPAILASSSFNVSVADLLMNLLIVTVSCGYLFYVHSKIWMKWKEYHFVKQFKNALSMVFLLATFFVFLFPFLVVDAVFHDSKIALDISEDVSMSWLQIAVIAATVLSSLSSFFFAHVLVRWAKDMSSKTKEFLISLLIAAAAFVLYSFGVSHDYWIPTGLGAMYILALFGSDYFNALRVSSVRSFSFLLIPIILYALQIALANRKFLEERKIRSMERFASSVLERDVLGEYLLNEAIQKISSDVLIRSSMENPLLSKRLVRDKIRERYLGEYFDRYHIRIALYKSDGVPADNATGSDLVTAIKSYGNDANKTQYANLYFVGGTQAKSATQYLSVINLSPAAGFIVIELTLKRLIPIQSLPELVVDNRFAQSFKSTNYSFAFYENNALVSSFGDFNFDKDLDSNSFNLKFSTRQYLAISKEDENGKRVLVVTKSYPFFMVLANFAFYFVLGIGILFVVLFWTAVKEYRKSGSFAYAVRIQSFAYLAFILPLSGVSFIALKMINQTNQELLENDFYKKGKLIADELAGVMNEPSDSLTESSIRNYLSDIAQASSIDLSLFDKNGALIAASSSELFENGLVSELLNRNAFEAIFQKRATSLNIAGNIGDLSYSSIFFSIRSELTGNAMAVLELPFLRTNETLNTSRINVIANILVIFTAMFLLFATVTMLAVDSFIWPFKLMAKTLKATQIGGNKPLAWDSNDEVGLMVKEYNQMVANIEKSKQALERSQRESAWREIAQQVAHEIKNPLTPIKLTLQQMERSLPNGLEPERVEKSVKNLLIHVDNLDQIATAFSSFAKLPSPQIKVINLTEIINGIITLHSTHKNRSIVLMEGAAIAVKADPKLLSGVFSNIILNAFQSRHDSDPVRIEIAVTISGTTCVIAFRDNGSGIAEELKDKIFIPHFSTKETGSGLGLAISKQAIESMGGKIWFESKVGVGTTFFVELLRG